MPAAGAPGRTRIRLKGPHGFARPAARFMTQRAGGNRTAAPDPGIERQKCIGNGQRRNPDNH